MMSRAIPGRALEVRYLRSDGKHYKHPFTQPVRMIANRDGSVTLRGKRRIWADDAAPGFSRYLHNPPPRVVCGRARGGFSFETFIVFILAATIASKIIGDRVGGSYGAAT